MICLFVLVLGAENISLGKTCLLLVLCGANNPMGKIVRRAMINLSTGCCLRREG